VQIFRSGFGKAITWIVAAIMLLALGASYAESGFWGLALSLAPASLLVFAIWAMFYRPRVEVGEGKVLLINVFRTFEVPINAISRIDTRWALTLFVAGKKYSAWGAVAPGRHTSFFATKDQGAHLPESSYLAGTIRPGDLVTTDSGAAAATIRALWEPIRDQVDASAKVQTHWHTKTILVLVLLTGLSLAL
jgi:hypothetical protein